MSLSLNQIVDQYSKYINNYAYVYKSCCVEWIVILRMLKETKTNEVRCGESIVYDYKFGKFRGTKFEVVLIFNKFDPSKTIKEIFNSCYKKTQALYVVGKCITPDSYDKNKKNISSNGIHYYRSIYPAYYEELMGCRKNDIPYTGRFMKWFSGGNIALDCDFVLGQKTGLWINYHIFPPEQKSSEGHYFNDVCHGIWIYWYSNGRKSAEGVYNKGKKCDRWIYFYENGRKKSEGYYDNNIKTGIWIHYYENGSKSTEGLYKNDIQIGSWIHYSLTGKQTLIKKTHSK